MVILKLQLGNDIRRVTVARLPSFQALWDMVPTYFRKKTPKKFVLKYLDDEQDLITLSSDEELKEAYRLAQKTGILKVKVFSSREPLDYVDDVTAASQKIFTNISSEMKNVATKMQGKVSPHSAPASPTSPSPQAEENTDVPTPADANFFHDVAQALENALDTITTEVRTMVGNFKEKLSQQTQTEGTAEMPTQTTQTETNPVMEEVPEEPETPSAPEVQQPPVFAVSEMEEKLNQLNEMGFTDRPRNIQLLIKNKGNVVETVKDLLEN